MLLKNKKKKLVLIILLLFLSLIVFKFIKNHSTYYKYDNSKILGCKSEQIVANYGTFDKIWNITESTNNFDSTWQGMYLAYTEKDPYGNTGNYYYVIYFDKHDIAVKVMLKHIPYFIND